MNIGKKKNSLKTGQTFYSVSNDSNNNNSNNNKNTQSTNNDIRKGKYPNGWFPFTFITLVFIVITVLGINLATLVTWKDVLVIASGISFCLSVAWWVLRQNFNLNTRWNLKKMAIQFRINKLKITEPHSNPDYSINNVQTLEDYSIYLNERTKRTKVFFLVTISLYALLFVVFLIVSLVK